MDIKEKAFNIVGGPSKGDLFDSCKHFARGRSLVELEFTVLVGYTAPISNPGCAEVRRTVKDVAICSIEHEDGSGESFNLAGYAQVGESHRRKFTAYYSTKRRTGVIKLIYES